MQPQTTNIVSLKLDQLKPNNFNPNRQTEEEFRQNVAEVRRLGRLSKPIVVRPFDADSFEIVDGEHGWLAAQEVGLTEVGCEIIEADDVEAMRQCYLRNRGGSDNPVLLGQMFERLRDKHRLSHRQIGRDMGVSESYIRSYLDYAKAWRLRTQHNPDTPLDDVSALTHREVQAYLDIGDDLRDKWFDAGHSLQQLDRLYEASPHELRDAIRDSGLDYVVEGSSRRFRPSLEYAIALAEWQHQHRTILDVDAYLQPVADLRIGEDCDFPSVDVLDLLPCRRDGDRATVALPVDKWAAILHDAAGRAAVGDGLVAMVERGVQWALKQAGVDPGEVLGPDVAEQLQIVADAPEFIREADWLLLEEAAWLAHVAVEAPAELLSQAKELTCEALRRQRCSVTDEDDDEWPQGELDDVLNHYLHKLMRARKQAAFDELFADHERLFDAVVSKLVATESFNGKMIDQQPAAKVLAERLRALPSAELTLLAAAALAAPSVDDVGARWLAAVTTV